MCVSVIFFWFLFKYKFSIWRPAFIEPFTCHCHLMFRSLQSFHASLKLHCFRYIFLLLVLSMRSITITIKDCVCVCQSFSTHLCHLVRSTCLFWNKRAHLFLKSLYILRTNWERKDKTESSKTVIELNWFDGLWFVTVSCDGIIDHFIVEHCVINCDPLVCYHTYFMFPIRL